MVKIIKLDLDIKVEDLSFTCGFNIYTFKMLNFLKSHGTHWDEVDLMIC